MVYTRMGATSVFFGGQMLHLYREAQMGYYTCAHGTAHGDSRGPCEKESRWLTSVFMRFY